MSSYAIGILGYCLILAGIVALTLISRRQGSRIASGRQIIAAIRSTRLGRILLVLGWGWVGWHLFVR